MTAVDCFDALASDRPYRKAMPLSDAMAVLKLQAGNQFDPAVVAILEQRHIELEERARKEGSAIVSLNRDFAVGARRRARRRLRGGQPDLGESQPERRRSCTVRSDAKRLEPDRGSTTGGACHL